MFKSNGNASCNCPEIQQTVSLKQSPAQCRKQHGCEQQHCPLEYDFMAEPIDFQLANMRFHKGR